MGWREALEDSAYHWRYDDSRKYGRCADAQAAALLAMPTADRIALARELLEGTGKCVADVGALMPLVMSQKDRDWQNRLRDRASVGEDTQ